MAAIRRVGVKDRPALPAPVRRVLRTGSDNEDGGAFLHVRNQILSPALEKRQFHSDAEFAGYFNLGSLQPTVVDRLVSQGFAKRVNQRLELCRFEPRARSQALSLRAHLDTLSFRLALPRLGEREFARIEVAALAFSGGPRLSDACDQIRVIMSILHEAAGRPLLAAVTQDLHRQLIPYTYLDRDRTAFDNLAAFFFRLPKLLQAGKLETLCSELSATYQQNAQLVSPALAEFRRFRREPPKEMRVARAVVFEAAA
jgi:hypothetical protein